MGTNASYRDRVPGVPGVLGRFSVHETFPIKKQGSTDTERIQESVEKEGDIAETTSAVDWDVDSIHPSCVALSCTSETMQQILEEQPHSL